MGLEMEGVPNQPSPIMGTNLRIQESGRGTCFVPLVLKCIKFFFFLRRIARKEKSRFGGINHIEGR